MPAGTFSLLFGAGSELGIALVTNPQIKAVGFTGSRSGGTALVRAAAARPEPIPVYAEMSSINPVYPLPGALRADAAGLGRAFIGSLTLGSGQFCTNPGLVIAEDGADLEKFIDAAAQAVAASTPTTMLTPNIARSFAQGVDEFASSATVLARGEETDEPNRCRAALFVTDAESFLGSPTLQQEICLLYTS